MEQRHPFLLYGQSFLGATRGPEISLGAAPLWSPLGTAPAHKRGICRRRAVFVCLSVRMSVTFAYYVKMISHPQTFFTVEYSHTILVFQNSIPSVMAIFRRVWLSVCALQEALTVG